MRFFLLLLQFVLWRKNLYWFYKHKENFWKDKEVKTLHFHRSSLFKTHTHTQKKKEASDCVCWETSDCDVYSWRSPRSKWNEWGVQKRARALGVINTRWTEQHPYNPATVNSLYSSDADSKEYISRYLKIKPSTWVDNGTRRGRRAVRGDLTVSQTTKCGDQDSEGRCNVFLSVSFKRRVLKWWVWLTCRPLFFKFRCVKRRLNSK